MPIKLRRRTFGVSVASALVVLPLFAASCAQATDTTGVEEPADAAGTTSPTSSDAATMPDRRAPPVDAAADAKGSTVDAGRDASADSGRDAGVDAAADATVDAGADAAVVDAGVDTGIDAGPVCATPCGPQASCVVGVCQAARRVFVSSTSYTADLGGAAGADATCQALATAASLGGTWMAWLSDSSTNTPSARMTHATVPYRLVDSSYVAASWAGLTGSSLLRGIDLDENGNSGFGVEVWTGTSASGGASSAGCTGYTSGIHSAPTTNVGIAGRTDATWSVVYAQFCDRNNRLYCIEQ